MVPEYGHNRPRSPIKSVIFDLIVQDRVPFISNNEQLLDVPEDDRDDKTTNVGSDLIATIR